MDATITRSFSKRYCHGSYHRRMPDTLDWQCSGIADSCVNSECFVFNISLLPNCNVNIMIIIVK